MCAELWETHLSLSFWVHITKGQMEISTRTTQRHLEFMSPNPVYSTIPQSRPCSKINHQDKGSHHPPSDPGRNISLLCKFPSAGYQLTGTHSFQSIIGHLIIISDTTNNDNTYAAAAYWKMNQTWRLGTLSNLVPFRISIIRALGKQKFFSVPPHPIATFK